MGFISVQILIKLDLYKKNDLLGSQCEGPMRQADPEKGTVLYTATSSLQKEDLEDNQSVQKSYI